VVAVTPGSPAALAGLTVGDEILAIDGVVPRDVLEYRQLIDEADIVISLRRGGIEHDLEIDKAGAMPLGIEVHAALFDQVRTCDNHCEFCFIYQLPKGMRKSLYLKDDDYRLSFLYGNFTTLTRFTEADLERVVTEALSPLNVSIHTTDPWLRAEILRNPRGATSLRWLRLLLDHGITVHGQVVVCPGVNDGDELDRTLASVLNDYPEIASVCVVPLGVSRFNTESRMRVHTRAEADRVVDIVESWQRTFEAVLGRRLVYAADEYYLMTDRPFPAADAYDGFPMYEDGVGMARAFALEFEGRAGDAATGVRPGFFSWVDGAPAEGYRAPRTDSLVTLRPRRARGSDGGTARGAPVAILTAPFGARVLAPLIATLGRDVRLLTVENDFFGGNIGVTGLMVGHDIARVLAGEPHGHRYLLPDVCLSGGRFLDGLTPGELPRPVEIIATDGAALRAAIDGSVNQ
jgi:putative radical SAM enzyme (TIGR03279 family)